MNRLSHDGWRTPSVFSLLLLLSLCGSWRAAGAGGFNPQFGIETNISELRNAVVGVPGRICAYELEGTILATEPASGVLFFEDNSGTTAVEADLRGVKLEAGQRVRIRGTNYVAITDVGLSLGTSPVVDADNLHSMIERSAEIHLTAGRHPIRVKWFNRTAAFFLKVEYSGPKIPRQLVPPSVLFHSEIVAAATNVSAGLIYRCYEGEWEEVPDFNQLRPQKTGATEDFNLSVKTRDENVGLEFEGMIEVPDDGNYRFYLSSDDGGQLFLDCAAPEIDLEGSAPVPDPQNISAGQLLFDRQESRWLETEGMITFISRFKNHVKLELAFGGSRMQVDVLSDSTEIPWYLLNSRVKVRGVCTNTKNVSGQMYAGSMVVANWREVRVLDVAPAEWYAFKTNTIGALTQEAKAVSNGIACLHGQLHIDHATQKPELNDGTGSATLELLTVLPVANDSVVDCLGRWSADGAGTRVHEAVIRTPLQELRGETNTLRILKTAMEVQRLTRDEADRKFPVELEGVATWISDDYRSFLIQDFTRAVFVWVGENSPMELPRVGDYCKVQGASRSADFSPVVDSQSVAVLWKGHMPPPISPTRDQLLSGSLDAQYVEIRGLVIATHDTVLDVLTADGILSFDVSPAPDERWKTFLNSIVRIRGCLFAIWDPNTHRIILDQPIRLRTVTVSIETPPPADLFEADRVTALDLMQFDVRFDTFRRVKAAGQIVHCGPEMNYLMDGATGLRFRLVEPMSLDPGDLVEVVGLVEPGGASPVLRQAIARKTGHVPLPEPRQLNLNSLSNNYDSTLVSVEGTLVDFQKHDAEQILEVQVGVKNFVARLDANERAHASWDIGSRLKLKGTFCALDGDRLDSHEVNSFEILLNSPADVQVLARPPWWTLNRLLFAIACLMLGLSIAFVWITVLRRQVERRTRQLGREISERERAEKMRAIEQERSRIARDLHDDLGSTLTEISMMATVRTGLNVGPEIANDRLREIAEKSRSMVSALDGLVWVVNSKNDTLSALIEYLASYAEEFLGKAQVGCRIELPKEYGDRVVSAEIRQEVMLAVREALNNAVKHGQPTEARLRITITGDNLEILVQDDGAGFDPEKVKRNGLGNLEQRMSKLNGSCRVESSPTCGTSIILKLILPKITGESMRA